MRTGPGRTAGWVILLLLLLAALNGFAETDFVPLSLNDKGGPVPNAANYLSDLRYADETITVDIDTGNAYGTVYRYAHIIITDPSQLRTAPAAGFSTANTLMAKSIAKRVNAVVAVNGDCFPFRRGGYIVRQGKVYRRTPSGQDLLMIDSQGDMTGLHKATRETVDDFYRALPEGRQVWNAFSFGPILVENGKSAVEDEIVYFNIGAQIPAQRACVAQIGPLEYLIVSTEGPEDPDGNGMTIPQFARVVETIGFMFSPTGIRVAYNLDGGTSNSLIFNNKQINSPNNPKKRSVTDIIYFSTLMPAK